MTYNDVALVLRGLSLTVPDGSIVALLGNNGAGKTTALKGICGLLRYENGRIEEGTVTFNGRSLVNLAPERIAGAGIALVPQGRRLFAHLTVEENLTIGGYTHPPAGVRRSVAAFLERFPAVARLRHREAGFLSGGEQQLVALGRAVVSRPSLLILDEPSLGLAPLASEQIYETIQQLHEEDGMSVLVVEQNAALALGIADYGYVLENGRVVLDGPADQLIDNPDLREFYLGIAESDENRRYDMVKSYRRRKRWLS